MNSPGIEQARLLEQMRAMMRTAHGVNTQQVQKSEFSDVLAHAVNGISDLQKAAAIETTKVERGDDDASLVAAMIASQKASVAFQAAVQVRNRFISAYQDVFNMPI